MNIAESTVKTRVVEAFDFTPTLRVAICRANIQNLTSYFFLGAYSLYNIDFGDSVLINPNTGESFLSRGNSLLTFRIKTQPIPSDLFLQLITKYL